MFLIFKEMCVFKYWIIKLVDGMGFNISLFIFIKDVDKIKIKFFFIFNLCRVIDCYIC